MNDTKRRLLGLFRAKSAAAAEKPRERDEELERESTRIKRLDRDSDWDRQRDRRSRRSDRDQDRRDRTSQTYSQAYSRTKRSQSIPSRSSRTGLESGTIIMGIRQQLLMWPPPEFTRADDLSQGKAMELIASGAPIFKGYKVAVEHVGEDYCHLFAMTSLPEMRGRTLLHTASFRVQGERDGGGAEYPWETLEQPSMAFCYGSRPGTRMLNWWVSSHASLGPELQLRDAGSGLGRNEVALDVILARLIQLEKGAAEDEDEDVLYKSLYKILLRDPDKYTKPHRAMEKQIADLIVVLSRNEWIDFSKPENQVVAKFFTNGSYTEGGKHRAFFHQLLLAMELDVRIQRRDHGDAAKERLLKVLPERVKWDLALARRWREGVSIESHKMGEGGDSNRIKFNLKKKKSQIRHLKHFARALKWPNLPAVESVLKNPDAEPSSPIEKRSSDAMSYFTSIILPGPTLPFLTINTLIDIDTDASFTGTLAALSHMHQNCGFQYKSQTYWSSACIVGKVLAPTCREVGGWIGPVRPASGLERTQIARIRQRKQRKRIEAIDIETMAERSLPLGPAARSYPISEYTLLLPDLDPDSIVDVVRIEKLALKPPKSSASLPESEKGRPGTFDACVQFAVDGQSWPLRLSYDVCFVGACPCKDGPHPLFFDYTFQRAKVDEILRIRDWGGSNAKWSLGDGASSKSLGSGKSPERNGTVDGKNVKWTGSVESNANDEDEEKVLLIEAYGVSDNEVLARAWCAHWGLSALVADVESTCIGCAVREAYAACLNVVILVEGKGGKSRED